MSRRLRNYYDDDRYTQAAAMFYLLDALMRMRDDSCGAARENLINLAQAYAPEDLRPFLETIRKDFRWTIEFINKNKSYEIMRKYMLRSIEPKTGGKGREG